MTNHMRRFHTDVMYMYIGTLYLPKDDDTTLVYHRRVLCHMTLDQRTEE